MHETRAAHRADDLLAERGNRRLDAVAFGHRCEPSRDIIRRSTMEYLGHGADRAAQPRYRRALRRPARQEVVDPVHVRPLGWVSRRRL